MTKRNRIKIGILALGIAVIGLTACGNTESKLPNLSSLGKVTAISREEGSGTRSEFETILNTSEAGAKVVAISSQDVQEQVANDMNAIGYAAYSSTTTESNTDSVKMIKVDGKELTAENIRKQKYPLCRNYYLAYSGELSALQQDFLSYVMSKGQKIVEKDCVSVQKASTFLSDKSSGEIVVMGSTSAASLIEEMAKDYATYNPNAKVKMISSDSSQGLTSAIRGECDFAVSSRDLKDYESELLTSKAFARDGIAIVVNKENPVENLSMKQIKKLYDGECKEWGKL